MAPSEAIDRFRQGVGEHRWPHLIERLDRMNRHIRERGIKPWQNQVDLLTGYSYGEFYDWDLYFENIYMSYFGVSRYCRNNLEAFLDQQHPSGFVARTLAVPRMRHQFKPFLAQVAVLGCRQGNDWRWLRGKYYDRLVKYLDYWFWYCDLDKNGLAVWDGADHSGMDNQIRRAGELYSMTVEGVDLNCYLWRELHALAIIAEQVGKAEDAKAYRLHAGRLAALINEVMWDDRDGFYYDRNERTGQPVRVKSVAGFTPLWLGIADPGHASRLIDEHLTNPREFWINYPVASWSKSEPDYYQQRRGIECTWMGATWIPTNYMIAHGLVRYGRGELAGKLAYRTLDLVLSEADAREYYDGETGAGQGLNPFWGWSGLGYLLALELELGYDATDLDLAQVKPIGCDLLGLQFPRE
ncbi:MAG: trehalase family glycosidase [Phycisphaerae bacterium]|jgi:hypothetical protein